jgi:hypothetical protein
MLIIIRDCYLLIKFFPHMAFPVKQVQTLKERLCIIEKPIREEDVYSQATRPATINPKYDYCEEKDQRARICVCGPAHNV